MQLRADCSLTSQILGLHTTNPIYCKPPVVKHSRGRILMWDFFLSPAVTGNMVRVNKKLDGAD